jgi:hypothetical protein
MPNAGDELHHFGWNACSSGLCPNAPHPQMERRYLVVPGLLSSRIHILDTKPDPKKPKIVKVIEPAEVADKTGYTRTHTVHCGALRVIVTGTLGFPIRAAFSCGRYATAALAAEMQILAATPRGGRNHQLNRSAFSIFQLVAGGELDGGEVERCLVQACVANGLVADDGWRSVMRTIASGRRAGMMNPRGRP